MLRSASPPPSLPFEGLLHDTASPPPSPSALLHLQAFALSRPDRPELVELLRAQPVLPSPGHRIVVEPPSTLEPLPLPPGANLSTAGGLAADGQAGAFGLGGMGYAGSLGTGDDAAAGNEEALPDDVPLTRAQLQAKVGSACEGWTAKTQLLVRQGQYCSWHCISL